jgi:hypothetical protein
MIGFKTRQPTPLIGCDTASKIAHHAVNYDLTPRKLAEPHVAKAAG